MTPAEFAKRVQGGKGSLVYLEGRLKTDRYEDKDGDTKYFSKVVGLAMQMLDRKPSDEPMLTVEEETSEYEVEPA